MSKGFSLSARLILQAPANVGNVVSAINRQLRGITANINVNISAQTQRQLQTVSKSITTAKNQTQQFTNEIERFGHQSALAIRRFAAFSVATAGFISLVGAIKRSFSEAIKFDREMVRVSQVTGLTLKNLGGLADEITRLSTSFGVSSAKIANIATILAQAGLTAQDTKIALEALAKTELSATFDDISDTTEGAIAIMAQFGTSASDLEKQLSSINVVAA